jgi:hypothetical protein
VLCPCVLLSHAVLGGVFVPFCVTCVEACRARAMRVLVRVVGVACLRSPQAERSRHRAERLLAAEQRVMRRYEHDAALVAERERERVAAKRRALLSYQTRNSK